MTMYTTLNNSITMSLSSKDEVLDESGYEYMDLNLFIWFNWGTTYNAFYTCFSWGEML